MRRALLVAAILLVVLAIGLYAALPRLTSSDAARDIVVRAARSLADIDLDIEALRVGHDLRLHATNLRAAWADREPFASITRFELAPPWIRPGAHAYTLGAVRIEGAELILDHAAAAEDRIRAADDEPKRPADDRPLALSTLELDGLFLAATIAGVVERVGPIRARLDGGSNGAARISLDAMQVLGLPALHAEGTMRAVLDAGAAAALEVTWTGAPLSELLRRAGVAAVSNGVLDGRLRLNAAVDGIDVGIETDGVLVHDLNVSASAGAARAKRLAIGGRASLTSAGDLDADLTVSLEGVAANDTDYRRVVDALSAGLRAKLRRTVDGLIACDCSATVTSGEALWDRFWVDLGRFVPDASARIESSPGGYRARDGRLTLRGLADWTGEVAFERPSGRRSVSGHLQISDLATLLEVSIKEPFAQSYPALADASAGGKLTADFTLTQLDGSGFSLHGRAKLRDASLRWRQPSIALDGVDLDLPLALGTAGVRDGRLVGRVAVESFELLGSPLGGFDTPITVGANTLRCDESVRLNLFGGVLTLEELSAQHLFERARVRSALALTGVDLAKLTRSLELPKLQGTATGRLGPVTYENGAIACEGGIRLETLGGVVELSGLGAAGLFSPVPALELDASFQDLSLEALTAAVEVGRVSGVIAGEIEDLVLVRGQPVSLKARVATTRKSGVRQTISVKALDQISILGGSQSNALSRGIVGLFDRYRYQKMGFSSSLENDRFTLRGIDRSGGKDLLVVGSLLPPTVNVVSHSQVIAFSEMVRRLARVRATGASEIQEPKEHMFR